MFSPASVLDVRHNLELTKGGKRHALLDNMLLDMQPAQESKPVPEPNVCAKRPVFLRPSAPPDLSASSVSIATDEIRKMRFSDFQKHGWVGEDTLSSTFCHDNESIECIENIKSQFHDFTFLLDCGYGGFGHVWLVQDMTGMIVALKTILKAKHEFLQKELSGLTLYRQNIKNFKNLVQVHHVGQTKDFFFYTMDAAYSLVRECYIPLTLDNLFRYCDFYPMDGHNIVRALLDGVSELHTHALSHRDIKPDNIIFIDGTPKLCDIGLLSPCYIKAKDGTGGFIPPDFAKIPDDSIGVSCDLYAMGKVLYEILANDSLFLDFPTLSKETLRDTLGKNLNKVINTACASSQSNRFHTADEFTQALDNALLPPKGFFSKIFG